MRMRRILSVRVRKLAHFSQGARRDCHRVRRGREKKMEEAGSTSLRAELQVILEDPANFYNVVMSNSGEDV